jgi:hypothetical protein
VVGNALFGGYAVVTFCRVSAGTPPIDDAGLRHGHPGFWLLVPGLGLIGLTTFGDGDVFAVVGSITSTVGVLCGIRWMFGAERRAPACGGRLTPDGYHAVAGYRSMPDAGRVRRSGGHRD